MVATTSQLSCFSSINCKLHLQRRSVLTPSFQTSKSWVVMSLDGKGTDTSEIKADISYTADVTKRYVEGTTKLYPNVDEGHAAGGTWINEPVQEYGVPQQKKGALIHDFRVGIPYSKCALFCEMT